MPTKPKKKITAAPKSKSSPKKRVGGSTLHPKAKAAARAKPPEAPKAAARTRASTPLVKALCTALADKKAEDIRVLDVGELSSITDYLVIATGNSETHLRALRIEADRILKEAGTHIIGRDTQLESGWTVVDAFDVMIHLFTGEKRENYRLEHLWRDADEVSVDALLGEKPKKK